MNDTSTSSNSRVRLWLKRMGIAGFLFFLLKGIAWLFVIWGGSRMIGC